MEFLSPTTLADALAARIRQGCLEMPDPEHAAMFDHVYAETTPLLLQQSAAFAAYSAGFADQGATR